jgi:hypothetical protein
MVLAGAIVYVAAFAGGCATTRVACPAGTELGRQVFTGGAEAAWCRRPDGVRQGPETRSYDSGVEMASGGYVDGALSGVWRYRFTDGSNWRAERWEDGALVQTTIDPAVARMSSRQLEARGSTSSAVIKLASHDPIPGRETRETGGATFASWFPNGRPQVAGQYDADGLRDGIWRYWFEDGRPARELEFVAGVRERAAREWHPNGRPAADGFYAGGRRAGHWYFWNDRGQVTADIVYQDGVPVTGSATAGGGMLPPAP